MFYRSECEFRVSLRIVYKYDGSVCLVVGASMFSLIISYQSIIIIVLDSNYTCTGTIEKINFSSIYLLDKCSKYSL